MAFPKSYIVSNQNMVPMFLSERLFSKQLVDNILQSFHIISASFDPLVIFAKLSGSN